MSAMLGALIDQVADEIRLGLSPDILAYAEHDRDNIVPRLWRSGALDRPTLVLLLLRRADEQSIRAACRERRARARAAWSNAWSATAMARWPARPWRWPWPVAAAATALAGWASNSTTSRSDEAHRLVHLVAGAIRAGIAPPSVTIDEALAAAAARLLDRHDERRRVEVREVTLAEALYAARGPDDELITALATEGDAALLAASCAVRAGIASETAWMLLVDDGASDAMLLARLAGLARPAAASLVATLGEPLAWGDPGDAIGCFDRAAQADVDAARRWWRLPPSYRSILAEQGGSHGQPRI